MQDSLYHAMDAPLAPIDKKIETLKPAEKAFFVMDLKLGVQVILVVAVIGAGFDFVPWAQWKYRDYSSANSGTTHEHGWGKCTWTNGQCPSFTSGPICVASPGTQECKDEGRHAMYATTHDAADCAQTCVDPATKLNCGQYQAIIMDDVQSETRVEWEVGRDIQHFTTWVAGAVALYTLKMINDGSTETLSQCIRAIIVLVLGTLLAESISLVSTMQSCNDDPTSSHYSHACDPSHPASTAAPAAEVSGADPIMQCEEQRDLWSIFRFLPTVVCCVYFIWILSSYEKSERAASPATAAAGTSEPV